MGHIHFDNHVKVIKREIVREIPHITKPTNALCKNCQQGKQTKTRFKSKEYSTTRPLEVVHTDLIGPTTTKGLKGDKYFMLLVDDIQEWLQFVFSRINQKLLKTSRSTRKWLKMKWIQNSNA
jgi:hypothetical protein